MSVSISPTRTSPQSSGAFFLKAATRLWFATALVGQTGFILFILGFYGTRTITGQFSAWNDKPLLTGHVEGDFAGNLVFAAHVLLAAVMTLSGLIQLIPNIRKSAPRLHRINGRIFLLLAVILAMTGIWMTWIRGSQASFDSAIAVSLNGVLILVFSAFTIRHAVRRRIRDHEIWALRLFMVAAGVWFFRVFIMAWSLIGRGMFKASPDLQPVIDPVLEFGSYMIPLLLLELWRAARASRSGMMKTAVALLILFATGLMATGVFGTIKMMWLPYL
ncbi:DUF2306 domain-containing protein [Ponticaulis sp.]|uniref:DUF2306 domain-containing protein n=1 Tax=Ponticaulis sp. TaxID=2020902 RepID=UPI000C61513D|nr:DUF2306 domain-containing protein [Ponticaulis sp.]MAF56416.1 hypothetical protein [Ponticaulis sp.]MBN05443.1 hypothetical protein [Ponticaulis sp.]